MTMQPHEHIFTYLTKEYPDGFTARVREIPAVFVSSDNQEDLEEHIRSTTLDYLNMFRDEHNKALRGELIPILVSPKSGVVIAIKEFTVKC